MASTTGVTDASATIAVCLMESAATTMNLSAPQVRPFHCLDLQHPAELRFLLTITEPLHVITSNNQPCSLTAFVCLLCVCAQQKTHVRGAVEKTSNEAGCVAVTLTAQRTTSAVRTTRTTATHKVGPF